MSRRQEPFALWACFLVIVLLAGVESLALKVVWPAFVLPAGFFLGVIGRQWADRA